MGRQAQDLIKNSMVHLVVMAFSSLSLKQFLYLLFSLITLSFLFNPSQLL